MRRLKYNQAISEATIQCMQADPNVFIAGIGVKDPGGVFGTTEEANELFPDRVFDIPNCENAFAGITIGAAAMGKRPLVVHPRNDFMFLATDMLINLAATSRPSGFTTSSVMPRLPRLHCRNIAPTPSEVTGVIHRSSPPSTRSTRITSAPRSPSNAPQYGPAMYRPKSTTRVPSSTPITDSLRAARSLSQVAATTPVRTRAHGSVARN